MTDVQTLTPYVQIAEAGCIAAAALEAGGTVADRAAVLLEAYLTGHGGALIPLSDVRTAERLVRAARPGDGSEAVAIRARFLSGIADALWLYETELGVLEGRFALEASGTGELLYVDENGVEVLEDRDR